MRVLMLSTDESVLDPESPAGSRMRDYASLVEKLDILLVTKANYCWRFFYRPAGKVDLVTSQEPFELGFLGWRLAKRFGAKLQLQIHTDFLSPYFAAQTLKNKIRVRLAKFLLPRADCIRVVSERIRRSLNSKFEIRNSKIITLPIFVDVERIKNAPVTVDLHKKYPQFDFIILMAGRLTREKNISLAIEAVREIVKKYPRTGLIIVGSGPEETKLKLMTNDYGLMTNIVFEPWTNDLVSYYKTADLFLLTSNYEGYGLTLVEATAAGCRVVSTPVGVAKELPVKIADHTADNVSSAIIETIENHGPVPLLPEKFIKSKEQFLREMKLGWTSC